MNTTEATNAIYAKATQYNDTIIKQRAENKALRQQINETNKLLEDITKKMTHRPIIPDNDILELDLQTLLQIYERLTFELSILNDKYQKELQSTKSDLTDMRDMLKNSQKYYYVICKSLI